MKKPIVIEQEDFGLLCVCALRYCHGRQTYMPQLVQEIVEKHLEDVDDKNVYVIANDGDYMNDFDYGNPSVDKPMWIRFNEKVRAEKKKRYKENEGHY